MKWVVRILVGLLILLVAAFFGAQWGINYFSKKKLDEQLVKMKDQVEVEYESYHYNLFQRKTYLRGVTGIQKPRKVLLFDLPEMHFEMDELVVHEAARDSQFDMVSKLNLTMDGMRVQKLMENGELKPAFSALGYDNPEMNMAVDFDYSPKDQLLMVNEVKLHNEEMGVLEIATDIGGITALNPNLKEKGMSNKLTGALQMLGPINFQSGDVVYQDRGLARRFVNMNANEQGLTKEEFAKKFVSDLSKIKKLKPSNQSLEAIEAFLVSPDQLRIKAKPKEPIGSMKLAFAMFMPGSSMERLFGIEVTN